MAGPLPLPFAVVLLAAASVYGGAQRSLRSCTGTTRPRSSRRGSLAESPTPTYGTSQSPCCRHQGIASADEEGPTPSTENLYKSGVTGYSFRYPGATFKPAPKLLKTHKDEVFFKSTLRKKYNFGVTADPVTIGALSDFGSVEEVADKIIALERDKEGVLNAELRRSGKTMVTGHECYTFDYTSNSTRGNIHYLSNLVIDNDKNLHTFTIQAKQEDFDEVKDEMTAILSSFALKD